NRGELWIWKDRLPVRLHVDDGPAAFFRLVHRLVEPADARIAVIGVFALGIDVVHDTHESRAGMGGSPLQHLQVAVRVAEGENRITPRCGAAAPSPSRDRMRRQAGNRTAVRTTTCRRCRALRCEARAPRNPATP